jgi:hypothetical protein
MKGCVEHLMTEAIRLLREVPKLYVAGTLPAEVYEALDRGVYSCAFVQGRLSFGEDLQLRSADPECPLHVFRSSHFVRSGDSIPGQTTLRDGPAGRKPHSRSSRVPSGGKSATCRCAKQARRERS